MMPSLGVLVAPDLRGASGLALAALYNPLSGGDALVSVASIEGKLHRSRPECKACAWLHLHPILLHKVASMCEDIILTIRPANADETGQVSIWQSTVERRSTRRLTAAKEAAEDKLGKARTAGQTGSTATLVACAVAGLSWLWIDPPSLLHEGASGAPGHPFHSEGTARVCFDAPSRGSSEFSRHDPHAGGYQWQRPNGPRGRRMACARLTEEEPVEFSVKVTEDDHAKARHSTVCVSMTDSV